MNGWLHRCSSKHSTGKKKSLPGQRLRRIGDRRKPQLGRSSEPTHSPLQRARHPVLERAIDLLGPGPPPLREATFEHMFWLQTGPPDRLACRRRIADCQPFDAGDGVDLCPFSALYKPNAEASSTYRRARPLRQGAHPLVPDALPATDYDLRRPLRPRVSVAGDSPRIRAPRSRRASPMSGIREPMSGGVGLPTQGSGPHC